VTSVPQAKATSVQAGEGDKRASGEGDERAGGQERAAPGENDECVAKARATGMQAYAGPSPRGNGLHGQQARATREQRVNSHTVTSNDVTYRSALAGLSQLRAEATACTSRLDLSARLRPKPARSQSCSNTNAAPSSEQRMWKLAKSGTQTQHTRPLPRQFSISIAKVSLIVFACNTCPPRCALRLLPRPSSPVSSCPHLSSPDRILRCDRSPVGPTLTPCYPIEDGNHAIDGTVGEDAPRTGSEVVVLDVVHMAAGELCYLGQGAFF
jgi:hypothetical protein